MSTTDLPTTHLPTTHLPTTHLPTTHLATTLDGATDRLRSRVAGTVLVPGDAGYDERRRGWNLLVAHEPAVIVVAADVADIVAAVRHAAEHGLGVGVQATGHGPVTPIDGLLVDTSRLTDVIVEPERRTAWVGAGCTWGTVLAAAQEHGLAPLLGSSPTVGAVGYTLGGGLGWLARHHGAACDAVRCFEVVTPDGRVVRAAADEHVELFRALRGGGGGTFGVVTGMEIDLFPVTTVYAGNLLYPAEAAADVAERYVEWVAGAPDELTSSLVLMNFPPLPEVPEPVRGRSFTIVRGCWSGDLDEGRALLDGWRAAVPPVVDLWGELPFAHSAAISQDPEGPMPVVGSGAWLRRLDRGVAEVLAGATFPAGGPPLALFAEVRHAGGAVARGDRSLSALGHRDHPFLLSLVGAPLHHGPAEVAAHQQATKAALGDAVAPGAYLNFLEGAERRAAGAAAAGPEAAAALQALRAVLDPQRRFRYGVDR